ncbi:hypothetical protein D918_05352 [Trichuris suis]|nr:hypothetical protein D918_05352 [Trichuris suis]
MGSSVKRLYGSFDKLSDVLIDGAESMKSKSICSLSQVPRMCNYRMKTSNSDDWYLVSSFCRNRIAAVCDLFTYLRYLSQGLLRHGSERKQNESTSLLATVQPLISVYDSYVEVVKLRRNIALARLGVKCGSE